MRTNLSISDWHERFRQQAQWTEEARQYFFRTTSIPHDASILEVGCGTGVITHSLQSSHPVCRIHGIDILYDRLSFAREQDNRTVFLNADGFRLPYDDSIFDLTLCHYYLLWLDDPLSALKEMVRVTRTGRYAAALAEPDYGGRIDFPEELAEIGSLQRSSLISQGADPHTGRKLASLFHEAGLQDVQVHLIGGRWHSSSCNRQDFELEWQVMCSDLDGILSIEQMQHFYDIDLQACQNGTRIQYIPTFFAWGRKA